MKLVPRYTKKKKEKKHKENIQKEIQKNTHHEKDTSHGAYIGFTVTVRVSRVSVMVSVRDSFK